MKIKVCTWCENEIEEEAEFIKQKKLIFCSQDCKDGWIDKQSDDAEVDPDDIDLGLDEPMDLDDEIDDFSLDDDDDFTEDEF
jgi:hypothetical protein